MSGVRSRLVLLFFTGDPGGPETRRETPITLACLWGQRHCRCPGSSLSVWLRNSSCCDRLSTVCSWGCLGDVAPDLGDAVELLRKSLMSVPEREPETGKRLAGPAAGRRPVGSRDGTGEPGTVSAPARPACTAPTVISSRSCVTAARARRYLPHWYQPASARRPATGLHGPGTCCRRTRRPGKATFCKPANLTQAVRAPSGCWATPVRAEPGAYRKGETSDA